jgi:hypothetical protein
MAEESKILQIMPADGWSALFEDEDSIPLVCFALVQDVDENGSPVSSVRPMACVDAAIGFCDEYANYVGVERDDGDYEDDDSAD